MKIYAYNQLAPNDGYVHLEDTYEKTLEQINAFSLKYISSNEYKDYKVAVLPLLRALLTTSYNLSTNNILSFKFNPSDLNLNNKRKIVKPYIPAVKLDKVILSQYGNSIENHLFSFIYLMENEVNIKTTIVGNGKYKKRYISYNDWMLFSILFIYYDGRSFRDRYANLNLPHFIKKYSCSKESYKLALRGISELIFKEKSKKANNEDIKFMVAQLQRIDNIFYFFKINKMNAVRKKLFTTEFLKEVYASLDLEYEEVINLSNIFDEEVFKNDVFIEKCLKINYLDPLFVFEYFFRYNILKNKLLMAEDDYFQIEELKQYNIKTIVEKKKLKELISISKADALEYMEIICDAKIVYNSYEPKLIDSLFLKEYYFDNVESLIEYSQKDSFEEIDNESKYLDYLFDKVANFLPKYEKK